MPIILENYKERLIDKTIELYLIEVFTKRLVKKWLNIGLLSDIPL